jgi:hypothetical protein
MASIITRETAASPGDRTGITNANTPLTNAQIDQNFIELNNDKLEQSDAITTNTADSVVLRDGDGSFSAEDITLDGTLTATTITETSSIALKENVSPINSGLNSILHLNGVTYDRKDGSRKNEAGLIAEEVFEVLPNIVTLNNDGSPVGINYTKLTAYLIEAVKELKNEIESLKESK